MRRVVCLRHSEIESTSRAYHRLLFSEVRRGLYSVTPSFWAVCRPPFARRLMRFASHLCECNQEWQGLIH